MPRQNSTPSTSDYVNDPVFGVVPKDADTLLRLRTEAQQKGQPDPTLEVPVELENKVTDKSS